MREEDLAALRARLEATEHELEDLRAIRDALTPPDLPHRPGLDLAAAFLPAAAESVSGDFYLVVDGPGECTVLAVGDVVGHGLQAARRAAFVRTAFVTTAPFTDDPARLLSWVNTALTERAGTGDEFVTAACITYVPGERRLRWAYAGHPPAMWLDTGEELRAPEQGLALGLKTDLEGAEGSRQSEAGEGLLLYTDGLTEARRDGEQFGLPGVRGRARRRAPSFPRRSHRDLALPGRGFRVRDAHRRSLPARRAHRLRAYANPDSAIPLMWAVGRDTSEGLGVRGRQVRFGISLVGSVSQHRVTKGTARACPREQQRPGRIVSPRRA